MKKTFALFFLLSSVAARAEEKSLYCYTNKANANEGSIALRQNMQVQAKYNGTVIFYGNSLNASFESSLIHKDIGAICTDNPFKNQTHRSCKIEAKINIDKLSAERGGRTEYGVRVFPDHGGVTAVITYDNKDSNRHWWFKECKNQK